jgi:glycosyltransferase involved in cell wall biosynthesis
MRTRSGEVPGSRGSAEAATPFISVVVTAYHRMDFLLEAVRSVLVQDLERSSFEVIVLKDFVRPDIEAELARASPPIRTYTEELGTMGEMIARVSTSRGARSSVSSKMTTDFSRGSCGVSPISSMEPRNSGSFGIPTVASTHGADPWRRGTETARKPRAR